MSWSARHASAARSKRSPTTRFPGFTHEVLSSWHPLFTGSAAYGELGEELGRRGLEYLNTELPTATAFPDGSAMVLHTSLEANVAEFDRFAAGDGAAWQRQFDEFMANADLSFGVLGTELWSGAGLGLGQRTLRRLGRRGLLEFAGHALSTCRDWTTATFRSPEAHGLLAPWVLHTGLGPESAVSGFMTQVIACAIQLGGMPVPVGGGVKLVDALAGIVRDAGGELRTGADVERILVTDGGATGVALAGGETVEAARAVIAGVTPTQLYGRLLGDGDAPPEVTEAARRYRYGRAGMQIHLALDEPPRWRGGDAERLAGTAIVHVTPGLDGVSRAVNEADRGLLPAEATIVVGQPCAVDPSRAPEGKSILWLQLQELPAGAVRGDAAGELDVGDGTWTEELREAYADRIVGRLGQSIENLGTATLKRIALGTGRPRGAQSQPRRRRHLRRQLRARPEPPLAAARPVAGARHRGRGALARRGEHAPRAWPRRRLRLPRREGAHEAGARPPLACKDSRTLVKLALSTISTVNAAFEDEVRAYTAAGFDAIGLWEMKLPPDDAANRALLAEHGLSVANCVPTVPSFLPLAIPGLEGPPDPAERLEAICASITRLAAYEPDCVLCLSGPLGERSEAEARPLVLDGLRRAAETARTAGVRLAFEPIHPGQRETTSFVTSLADAIALLDEAGLDDVGLMADTYNLAREATSDVVAAAPRFAGLHVADELSEPEPGVRALPGEGTGRTGELVAALRAAGWDGTLDVEVFSTPESFWSLPVDEAAHAGLRRGRRARAAQLTRSSGGSRGERRPA